jgi:type 1 glutamine amidotransferase
MSVLSSRPRTDQVVIPAKAGTQPCVKRLKSWIPAFAGMTALVDSGAHGAVTRTFRPLAAFAAVLLITACASAPNAESAVVSRDNTDSRRQVLYFTLSAGFKHDVLPESERILRELGERSGRFAVTVSQDPTVLNARELTKYDALVFYTTGELPIDAQQKQDLLDFVEGGKGFVGVHSASDTFYEWPAYGRMLGGYFDKHPWHQAVTVEVEDGAHPATRHLGRSFEITDEIYQFKNWSRDDLHVLLRLDPDSVDLDLPDVHRTDRDFALAWTRQQGRGRVFYTALGHRSEVWNDPRFQRLLVGGLLWSMGEE